MSEIMKKLDDIIETTHEIISMLETCEKESEVKHDNTTGELH